MHGDMSSEVIGGDERFATVRALELLTAGVHAHMYFQGTRLRETLPTVHTAIASLSRVNALVTLEVAGVREAFPTLSAAERFFSGVNPHVSFQVLETRQSFAAETTDEQLLKAVTCVVRDTACTIVRDPVIINHKGIGSTVHVFSDSHLGVFCRQGLPLPAVSVNCRLVLSYGAISLGDGKMEIVA